MWEMLMRVKSNSHMGLLDFASTHNAMCAEIWHEAEVGFWM